MKSTMTYSLEQTRSAGFHARKRGVLRENNPWGILGYEDAERAEAWDASWVERDPWTPEAIELECELELWRDQERERAQGRLISEARFVSPHRDD